MKNSEIIEKYFFGWGKSSTKEDDGFGSSSGRDLSEEEGSKLIDDILDRRSGLEEQTIKNYQEMIVNAKDDLRREIEKEERAIEKKIENAKNDLEKIMLEELEETINRKEKSTEDYTVHLENKMDEELRSIYDALEKEKELVLSRISFMV